MQKVLLTGGSGFIAAHVLDILLERGYDVLFTVRKRDQGEKVLARYTGQRLSYVVLEDITDESALREIFKKHGSFDSVLHTASPFTTTFKDPVKDMLDPAIRGTTTILKAIASHAKSVNRVVLTSSFAAMVNPGGNVKKYDETSWNPITWEEAVDKHHLTYAASKTLAEKAAWEFMKTHEPSFDLVVLNPPLVFGPIKHQDPSSVGVNMSNQRILDMVQGKFVHTQLPPTGVFLWADVRDVAMVHVRALEEHEAGNQRLLVAAGYFSNKSLVDEIRKTHMELSSNLPTDPVDDMPPGIYGFDNSKALSLLQGGFRSFSDSVRDTVDSLI